MNYEQLVTDVQALAVALEWQHAQARKARQKLAWYDGLDPIAAVADTQAEVVAVSEELASVDEGRVAAQALLRTATRPRVAPNPVTLVTLFVYDTARRWHGARTKLKALNERKADLESRRTRMIDELHRLQAEAEQHAAFDRTAVDARLTECEDAIAALTREHGLLAHRLAAIDAQVAPLQADLHRVQEELTEMGRRRNSRYDSLRNDERRLNKRIQQIKRKSLMDVRTVIIDGSNLFFDDDNRPIGFFALRPLCTKLLEDRMVQVVFDHTIIRKQGLQTQEQIEALMPGVDVHVAQSKTDADELIFDLSDESTTYILSNDNYPEYKDKPAHADDRVLNVEIVRGRRVIVVPMLGITVPYTLTRSR